MANNNKDIMTCVIVVLSSVITVFASIRTKSTSQIITEVRENRNHVIKNFNECIHNGNINCDHFANEGGRADLLDSLHTTKEWITYNTAMNLHNDSMAAEMAKFRYDAATRKWGLK